MDRWLAGNGKTRACAGHMGRRLADNGKINHKKEEGSVPRNQSFFFFGRESRRYHDKNHVKITQSIFAYGGFAAFKQKISSKLLITLGFAGRY